MFLRRASNVSLGSWNGLPPGVPVISPPEVSACCFLLLLMRVRDDHWHGGMNGFEPASRGQCGIHSVVSHVLLVNVEYGEVCVLLDGVRLLMMEA